MLDKARERAGELLEANPDDIVLFDDGRLGVAGTPARSLGWDELAGATTGEPPLTGRRPSIAQSAQTYPVRGPRGRGRGRHRDRRRPAAPPRSPSTTAAGCSTRCWPRARSHGGLAQGIAQALFEEVVLRRRRQPAHRHPGRLPRCPAPPSCPAYETAHTETPTPLNPLGAKGIGESGTIGSTPGGAERRRRRRGPPRRPPPRHAAARPERVWRAIRRRQGGPEWWSRGPTAEPGCPDGLAAGFAEPTLRLPRTEYLQDHRPLLRRPARRGLRAAGRPAPRRLAGARRPGRRRLPGRQRRRLGPDVLRRIPGPHPEPPGGRAHGLELVGVLHSHTHTDA